MCTLPHPLTDQVHPLSPPSRSGSGKTLAFTVPIIAALKSPKSKGFRAVIVSPTRELAVQIKREFDRVAAGTKLQVRLLDKSTASVNSFGVSPQSSLSRFHCVARESPAPRFACGVSKTITLCRPCGFRQHHLASSTSSLPHHCDSCTHSQFEEDSP
jgi:hypothetical protein